MRPRPLACSLPTLRSRGARLLPCGRLLAARAQWRSVALRGDVRRRFETCLGWQATPSLRVVRELRLRRTGERLGRMRPRPLACSLPTLRSRGARLLPSGRLLAPRAQWSSVALRGDVRRRFETWLGWPAPPSLRVVRELRLRRTGERLGRMRPRPLACSLPTLRSRGARLLPSGRLLAPRA